ncbi:MAG: penicillin acylase family protein [SAR202 cluster bacterium]|nr:penicillin acylase family protein [SAR202 cluster bacterium]
MTGYLYAMTFVRSLTGPPLKLVLTALSRRTVPRTSGRLDVDGLGDAVEIIRDTWGVPHIYARSPRDAFLAQGFVHAQDRLFQMDLRRRVARGTLSEAFGAGGLATDRYARTLGIGRIAEAEWEKASPEEKEALQAYSDGVNACIGRKGWRRPLEFALVGLNPRPWEPVDSLAFLRLMIWQLAFGWHGELVRARLRSAVGDEAAAEWNFRYPEGNPTTIAHRSLEKAVSSVADPGIVGPGAGGGSNAWAIAGSRTDSGRPLLCNDPHLFMSSPSVWYENHLSAPGLNVTGASLAGVPAVMIGHNERIAWGITVAFTDCQDLFEERFDGDRYLFKDQWLDSDPRTETIRVKHEDAPVTHRVTTTRHGPIVEEGPPGSGSRYALSAVALTGSGDALALLKLNRAGNWSEFSDAIRRAESAQLNFVYADVDGNIGYRVAGRVPVRARGDGSVPAPGWAGTHEWTGYLPFDEMPSAFNPAEGCIVSANHKIAPDSYPHELGNAWMNGYRARRITDQLADASRVSVDLCRALQADVTSIPGSEFVQIAASVRSEDPAVRLAIDLLKAWDGRLGPDSIGGTVYEVARYHLIQLLLEPVDVELRRGLTGIGPSTLLAPGNELYANDTVAVLGMLRRADSWWLARAGGRDAVVSEALARTVAWLRTQLGKNPSRWRWGRIHRVRFSHPIGLRPPLDRVFDRGPYPIGGDMDTPAQSGLSPAKPFDALASCPSYRQIIDLADLEKSVSIHAPGQSGQIGNRHYDDLVRPWLANEYHAMPFARTAVMQHARRTLRLEPLGATTAVRPG